MSAGSCSVAALAAAGVLAAGCSYHEPEVRPFHLRVEDANGVSFVERFDAEGLVEVIGTGLVEEPTTLLLREATYPNGTAIGDLRIRFDGRASPRVVFDAERLGGVTVRAKLRVAPGGTGPFLEPLTVPGVRLFVDEGGLERSVLVLWEGTYRVTRTASVLPPAAPDLSETVVDAPLFFVEEQWAASEPAECGLLYYDNLLVGSADGTAVIATLGRRDREQVSPVDGLSPWTVEHLVSYHRDGRCEGQAQVYTQLAAWRPLPPPTSQ